MMIPKKFDSAEYFNKASAICDGKIWRDCIETWLFWIAKYRLA